MLSSISGWLPSSRFFMGVSLRTVVPLLAVGALALGAAACGGDEQERRSPEDVPADAIALVGESPIPRAEWEALMDRAKTNYKAQDRPFPKVGSPEYQDLKTRAVAYLLQRYQYRAEAEELGVSVSDEDVDKRLAEIKEQAFEGDDKKFRDALKREGLTEAEAREEIRARILEERLYEKVTEDIKVSEEEIAGHYEENKAQFTQPASRTVRHILVKNRARANDLYREITNGGNFASLARQFSQDKGSAQQGGRLPITKGQTLPEFDRVAFGLDRGEVSRPVKTQFGWHIIEAVSPVKRERVTPLDQVEDSIRQQLLQQKKNEALQKWIDSLEEKYESQTVYAVGFEPPKTETGTGTGTGTTGAGTGTAPATTETVPATTSEE
jgi:foldase protein PrsA